MVEIAGEELQSLKKKIEEVVEAFQVEEEPEGRILAQHLWFSLRLMSSLSVG